MSTDFQQAAVSEAMKTIAKLFDMNAEYREYVKYHKQILVKDKKARPSAQLKKSLKTLNRISVVMNRLYANGYHDGAHSSAFSEIEK